MPEIVSPPLLLLLAAVVGYALGSIPFGVIVARAFGLGDLRAIGSGNIGATNVLRTGSKGAAALTLVLDAGKGAAAVLLARAFAGPDAAQLAALAAFLGHCFPVWLRFRGGKGVATFLGTALALYWPLGISCCAVWLVMAVAGRRSSLAALVAAALAPVLAIVMAQPALFALTAVLAVLLWVRHHENIRRLFAGTESRIGQGR